MGLPADIGLPRRWPREPSATPKAAGSAAGTKRRIGLFGSTARNEATASSDVDVWVELDPLTPFATVHLKQELEALLQRTVGLVRLRERMNPALRQEILRDGIST